MAAPELDLEATPVPNQIGNAVINITTGDIVSSSNIEVEDAKILYAMLEEAGRLTQVLTRMSVTMESSVYVVATDKKHVYISEIKP